MTIQKKLNFNALPLFAHGRNLRQVSQHYWRQVRSGLIEEQGCRCEVCGAIPKSETDTRNFHAHEEWEFDLEHQILILKHIGIILTLPRINSWDSWVIKVDSISVPQLADPKFDYLFLFL